MCVGYNAVHNQNQNQNKQSSSYCLAEGAPKSKRRRPPIFGKTIPLITSRGLVTNYNATSGDNDNAPPPTTTTTAVPTEDISNRSDCPLCKKFGSGPCGDTFKTWLACTDTHPGKDATTGEPIHLGKCSDLADTLAVCLDQHQEYYIKYDDDEKENDGGATHDETTTNTNTQELKDAWNDFVHNMEDRIASNTYKLQPYPQDINPTIQVRTESASGAAFFKPENSKNNGQPLLAAYLLDDSNGSVVIAAGSKDDMDMGGTLGCVLQFKVGNGMQSVTVRAIYDTAGGGESMDDIEIFSGVYKLIP